MLASPLDLLNTPRNLPLFIHEFVFVTSFGHALLMPKLLLHPLLHLNYALFILNAHSSFQQFFLIGIGGPQFMPLFFEHLRESLLDQLLVVAELLISFLICFCKSATWAYDDIGSISRFAPFR